MFNPVSTYRIQFHKDFTLDQFERVIPYLEQLGIGTVYASPVFEAVPGSTHGYDGVNPQRINPEIGTEEQLRRIATRLKEKNIGWLQDIVPNHMAFHPNNAWLMDVLEKGKHSAYATFFDIGWDSGVYDGKLMVPFLGAPLEEVILRGDLKLANDNGRPLFQYFDSHYPLNERSRAALFQHCGAANDDVQPCIDSVNNDKTFLLQLAEDQHYQLCKWDETDERINYRRFFTINGLICLNIQEKHVFDAYHELTKKLVDDGVVQGLRIDHIDGLYDPTKYLDDLKALVGDDKYVVVEKILQQTESLPNEWDVEGNTGYDFLAIVNNLFSDTHNADRFRWFYRDLLNDERPIAEHQRQKKGSILYNHMNGELDNLATLFERSGLVETNGVSREQLK
ncbi:MAG TPA: alpha-amylase family glycosyl hydrolase, partial [Chitinophagales bacterium]|nr:alpha-amylase family glycosyl hydrolase [Chitinophagales bacterium]